MVHLSFHLSMKKITKTMLLLTILFFATGCTTQTISRHGPQGQREYSYTLVMTKSRDNTQTIEILLETTNASLSKLLQQTDLNYELDTREGSSVVVALDGVVTTQRMGWNIYIDGLLQNNFDFEESSLVRNQIVALRYEEIGTQELK